MNWWCSTTSEAWSWSWQAYPGVWLFVGSVAALYVVAIRRSSPPQRPTRKQQVLFAIGLLVCWLAADWPIGALGSGYLLSVHQLQYVLFVMIAPPLMLLGTPHSWSSSLGNVTATRKVASFVENPVAAIITCNAIVVATHFPNVVDGLMQYQVGSFSLDMAWLLAGCILWWPVLQPRLSGKPLSYPARFAYLLVATLLPGIPAAFFFFARFPIYRTYELAPPLGLSTIDDQFVGGIVMKLGSFIVVFVALSVLFYKWHAVDRGPRQKLVLPEETVRW